MDELLRQLGAAVGIANLAMDGKGTCSLRVDGEVFTLRHDASREPGGGGEIIFVHQLAALPQDDAGKLDLYAFLLEKNCLFRGVGPGILGISPEDNGVFYAARTAAAGLAYPDYHSDLPVHIFRVNGPGKKTTDRLTDRTPERHAPDRHQSPEQLLQSEHLQRLLHNCQKTLRWQFYRKKSPIAVMERDCCLKRTLMGKFGYF